MNSIEKIQAILPDEQTAALVTSEINARYFSEFSYTDGAVLITKDEAYLLCDFRYIEAAERFASPDVTVVKFNKLYETLNDIFLKKNIKQVMLEEEDVTIARLSVLQKQLHPELLTESGLSAEIRAVRVIKTPREIEQIIKAQRITERALNEVLNYLKPGVTEREIAVELEHLIKKFGGERIAFDLICITGANTSLPHGVPCDSVVKEGDFFTFDIGSVYEGYHSDMTRTFAVKSASDEMREIYDIVLQAHLQAEKAIKAGNTTADVDIAARDYIESRGYGEYFGHSTGHGVGLEIHEDPRVYKTDKTVLKDGMVITDEPGIYLPGKFGVRIEDMFLVQGEKAVDLALIPKELTIV